VAFNAQVKRSTTSCGGIIHEGVAFTPSNANSRLGYFRGNVGKFPARLAQPRPRNFSALVAGRRRPVGGGVRLNVASLCARTWLENGEETHRSTAKVATLHPAIHGAPMAQSPSRPSVSASPTCRRASATTLVTPYVRQARSSTWAVPPSGPAGNSRRPVARRRGARRRPRQSYEASQ
jgi:hypothetical protein